jgi:general secretion pathway protein N
MAGREMMRVITTGVVLLALSASGASALISAVSNDALDAGLADEAVTAAAHPAPAAASQPAVLPSAAPASARALSANPLWAIPLTRLSGTRDRPIFSPSRRPAPAAAAAEPVVAKAAPPSRKRDPEPPPLSLIGTIASDDEGFGIFLDPSTKTALRLKLGEDYQGWKLRSIRGREVTMEKDQQAAILSLPEPGAGQAVGEVRLLPISAVTSRPSPVNPAAEHFR